MPTRTAHSPRRAAATTNSIPDPDPNPSSCAPGRRWRSAAAVLALGLALAACGGGGGGGTDTGGGSSAAQAPDAPTLTFAGVGDAQVTLEFDAPANDHGAAVTGYTGTCAGGGRSVSASGSASPIVVSPLVNGTAYACTVTATNAAGTSAPSETLTVTPQGAATVPGAPVIGAATAGDGSAGIAFTAPASDGGSAITSYVATCADATGRQARGSGSASPVQVAGLVDGTAYTCSVAAVNAVGTGASSGTVTVTPTAGAATVPGAPTLGALTAGDGSAVVAFDAPASDGGSAITQYTAACTAAGGAGGTASGSGSPLTVTGLADGTAYACSVTATNAVGTGPASSSGTVTPSAGSSGGTTTAGVACDWNESVFNSTPSVNATSTSTWGCTSTTRTLSANGLPDHATGTFPSSACPNPITSQSVAYSFTLSPAIASSTGTSTHVVGYGLNGVKFDPATAGTCDDSGTSCSLIGGSGSWNIEALGQASFDFGADSSNAHVQPTGEYHYHGMPEGLVARLGKGTAMTLVGWAVDGYPIYARYGYSVATDATSAVKVLVSSYALKATPDANRPSTSLYPMGTFTQDYEYVAGSGDLDECNGRTGVTPEFPQGIYYYVVTDTWPYVGRCVKGSFTLGGAAAAGAAGAAR